MFFSVKKARCLKNMVENVVRIAVRITLFTSTIYNNNQYPNIHKKQP